MPVTICAGSYAAEVSGASSAELPVPATSADADALAVCIFDVLSVSCSLTAGAFAAGSSIELSADGPVKPPYAVYFQGGLTWYHAKLGILMSLQKLYERNLVKLD